MQKIINNCRGKIPLQKKKISKIRAENKQNDEYGCYDVALNFQRAPLNIHAYIYLHKHPYPFGVIKIIQKKNAIITENNNNNKIKYYVHNVTGVLVACLTHSFITCIYSYIHTYTYTRYT